MMVKLQRDRRRSSLKNRRPRDGDEEITTMAKKIDWYYHRNG